MNMDDPIRSNDAGEKQNKKPPHYMRRIIYCTIIILAGGLIARHLIETKPQITRQPVEKVAPLVNVVPLEPRSHTIRIKAMGSVIPSREIVLKTPVAGEIIALNDEFTVGGLLRAGTTVLQIDPKDYELALELKERVLADAEYAYKLEQGRQDVARQEWDLLYGGDNNDVEGALALRKPHLEKVEADVRAARAEVEQARIDLSRTEIKAPFNALVLNKYVDRGAFVASQESLADLVGTDEYWVQVSLPLDRLQWLTIPGESGEPGLPARIYYRQDNVREGQVIRLLGDLSREGRMARLLISVPDPLGLQESADSRKQLVIGEYVRVELAGEELHDVFLIPRTALHNDREIWLATEEGRLAVRPVTTLWRDEESVLVKDGLQAGDLLIVTELPVPVDGMAIRIGQGSREAMGKENFLQADAR
ncbi:MAG: efflux RND transporter periplasmic adaptor subunit [Desulfobulbaceae bacterium]|nr:efflux RND transporter periplasmic adaptor subunit [Desulfobulbaceae bacterium]